MDETEAPTLDRPDITARLPRYRLVRQLARTRMSEVFEALDTQSGRPVALKVVGPEFMAVPGFRTRFERETRIARELVHPNVVRAVDAGFTADGGLGYLAMEYVRGTNLARLLDRGPLPFAQTVAIGRGIAAALDAAHARRLVHRDVKPGNILLDDTTGQAYLCDFGIARQLDLTQLTATGAFLGTVSYAAPEQRAGKPADAAADVYSLACVLYECLAGAPPHHHTDLAHPAVNVLRRSLSTNPAARHPTCTALVDDLVAATEAAQRRRRWVRAGIPAAAVVVVGLLVAWLTTGGPSGLDDATISRLPAALRADCATADPPAPGATSTFTCHSAGRPATTALYADPKQASDAYATALSRAGVSRDQGDCTAATGGEHRYPATGPALGRAFCQVRDGQSIVVWKDDAARAVTTATAPAADDAGLRTAWAGWTGVPAFPTADEQALVQIAAGTGCHRAPPADLGDYSGASAGVACIPRGTGTRAVSYYRFADPATLRTTFDGLVTAAKAPSGTACPGTPFLGTTRFDWLSVDLGQVLCHPGPQSTVAIDWSLESFGVLGHVTGTTADATGGWWKDWHLAPLSRIVTQVNTQSSPAFPTQAERTLLDRIPAASRVNCVRPSADQRWQDLGAVQPVAAVACGRTSGAELVVYYQLPDAATMNQVYNSTQTTEKACTDLPEKFSADRPYSRGGRTGRLACGTVDSDGERYLKWTDDQAGVLAVAHRGSDAFPMIDWWNHDAGPA
ncbi:serine/threonine-protein kinase [Amycolatopsis jejuensis]|uniref:serine/threonine-protein kinase n=1 Tax=Amycolatopsis jejuensis TaxID=330084 RepID=UPI00068DBC95|nr:serine/threonine-protein kinase [Amycolatopsis jejuensis]